MQRVAGNPAVRKTFKEDDARPIGQVVLTFDNPAALGGFGRNAVIARGHPLPFPDFSARLHRLGAAAAGDVFLAETA